MSTLNVNRRHRGFYAGLTGVLLTTLTAASGQAAAIFNYGPDATYVAADASFRRTATATGTGPFVTSVTYDDATSLSPSSGYTGPGFFGGYKLTSSVNGTLTRQQIRNNQDSADVITLQAFNNTTNFWSGADLGFQSVFLFKQAQFAPGYTTGQVAVDGLSVTTRALDGSSGTTDNWSPVGRWLVEVGGTYYLSSATITRTVNSTSITSTLTGAALANTTWAAYSPTTDVDFNAASATFGPLSLTGVTAAGVYFEDDAFKGGTQTIPMGLAVKDFGATGVVPEPGALGLAACVLGALVLRRRS